MAKQTTKTDVYDDDEVVEEIARGVKSYTEIAAEQGCTRQCISQIARGRRRKELHRRIMELQEGYLLQVRRLAVACAVQAMAVHIREGLEGEGETARRCREYVMNHVLGKPGGPVPSLPEAKPEEFDVDAMVARVEERSALKYGVYPFDDEPETEQEADASAEGEGGDLQGVVGERGGNGDAKGNCQGSDEGESNCNDAKRPATADLRQADRGRVSEGKDGSKDDRKGGKGGNRNDGRRDNRNDLDGRAAGQDRSPKAHA